jgi:LysR family transcriptional regulator of abg operon
MRETPWNLSLRQLEIFCAVAESGSIRAASRRVHLTQPAVTHAVRELERAIDVPLFTRSVKGVGLTEVGTALLRHARQLFGQLAHTQEHITQLRDGTGGRLSIAFSSAAAVLLPDTLEAFRAQRPGVELELQELSWPGMDERWRSGGYDFALVSEYEAPVGDGLHHENLRDLPLAVVARAGHPLAGVRSLARLQGCTWVVPGYGKALLSDLFGPKRQPAPAEVISCQSMQLAFTLLRRTDALALVSVGVLADPQYGAGLVRVPVPVPLARIRLSLLLRDPDALTPAARLFVHCLRQTAAKD